MTRPGLSHLVAALAVAWALVATILLLLRPAPAITTPTETEPEAEGEVETPMEASVVYETATFEDLPGWQADALVEALPALLRSCERLTPMAADAPLSATVGGTADDWRPFCEHLAALESGDGDGLRRLLTQELRPLEIVDPTPEDPAAPGLFTGYYEPTLSGSRIRTERHRWPLYRRPPELVELDLGRFRDRLAGETILGHVNDGFFVPYHRRDEIDAGNLAGRGLEVAWVDDPVDAFFLHIQGSGRVELADGSLLRVGYAGQNGHAYTAIGRELVRRGAMPLTEVSMQSIRAWLDANPNQLQAVLHTNPSYIFFRELQGPGPLGSLGAPLTPQRSLAVDREVVPLGTPVWVAATAPTVGGGERAFERLMSAQDTGGAIRGPQRGDVFWGAGEEAATIAGRMKHPGRMWVLLPRTATAATQLRKTVGEGLAPSRGGRGAE